MSEINIDEIDEITESMSINFNLYDNNSADIIQYINKLSVSDDIKKNLLFLVKNDNYNDYLSIYNICLENGIELPPL